MPYLIDGNNLMPHLQTKTRKLLLEKIANFAQIEKVKVSVVFDGLEDQFFPDGAKFKGINVFYSQGFSDADERIKKFVDSAKDRRSLIVVTSDNALANFCRIRGAKIIRSTEFCVKIVRTENIKINNSKNQGLKNDDISDWLRYFGVNESNKS